MRILITGVAGFIGSHVAEAFARKGHTVVGVDNLDPYYDVAIKKRNVRDIEKTGVFFVELDLVSGPLDQTLGEFDAIYHFAAQPGIASQVPLDQYVRNNILATHALLEFAQKQKNLKIFVHISTSSVYGEHAGGSEESVPKPTSFYGVTKLAAEQLALAYFREKRLPVISLRLFSVYGERERPDKLYTKLIASLLEKRPFGLHKGSENHKRSYTYVGDIVSACVLVLEKSDTASIVGEIFNIGSDKVVTTGEGIAIAERVVGHEAIIESKPARPGDQKETRAEIGKAKKVLGYAPVVDIEEGLIAQIEWARSLEDK